MSEVFYWIMGVVGGVISILLVIIGFFLVKFIKSVEDHSAAIESLKITISAFLEKFDSNEKDHETTVKRLDDHARRLNEHEICITELKVKIG